MKGVLFLLEHHRFLTAKNGAHNLLLQAIFEDGTWFRPTNPKLTGNPKTPSLDE